MVADNDFYHISLKFSALPSLHQSTFGDARGTPKGAEALRPPKSLKIMNLA